MRFLVRAKPKPTIPIVPLIDILCILLIFFIVTTTFKKASHSVTVDLPQSGGLAATARSDIRTVLALSKEGRIQLGSQELSREALKPALLALKASQPDAKVELKADSATSLQTMLEIWDALSAAQFPIKEVPVSVLVPSKQ